MTIREGVAEGVQPDAHPHMVRWDAATIAVCTFCLAPPSTRHYHGHDPACPARHLHDAPTSPPDHDDTSRSLIRHEYRT